MRRATVLLLFVLVACGKSSSSSKPKTPHANLPELTAELTPAALAGFTLLGSTEADVLAKFPTAKIGQMNFNDMPSDTLGIATPHMELMTTPRGKDGKLFHVELADAGVCDWVKQKMGSLDGAKDCPGNRKTGEMGSESYYCARTADGHVIGIDCTRNQQQALRDDGTTPPPIDTVEFFAQSKDD
jgi:hypothetical protein